jgi:hypothetical protein
VQTAQQAGVDEFHPPNIPQFAEAHADSVALRVLPRGRTGPKSSQSRTNEGGSQSLLGIFVDNVVVPYIESLKQPQSPQRRRRRRRSSTPNLPSIPSSPTTPRRISLEEDDALDKCIEDFRERHGIDMAPFLEALKKDEYTPGIIPSVHFSDLCKVTNAPQGRIVKFQAFCVKWTSSREVSSSSSGAQHAKRRRVTVNLNHDLDY